MARIDRLQGRGEANYESPARLDAAYTETRPTLYRLVPQSYGAQGGGEDGQRRNAIVIAGCGQVAPTVPVGPGPRRLAVDHATDNK